jgi:hypothetical protein
MVLYWWILDWEIVTMLDGNIRSPDVTGWRGELALKTECVQRRVVMQGHRDGETERPLLVCDIKFCLFAAVIKDRAVWCCDCCSLRAGLKQCLYGNITSEYGHRTWTQRQHWRLYAVYALVLWLTLQGTWDDLVKWTDDGQSNLETVAWLPAWARYLSLLCNIQPAVRWLLGGLSTRVSCGEGGRVTFLHVVSRLRISESIHLLLTYASVA